LSQRSHAVIPDADGSRVLLVGGELPRWESRGSSRNDAASVNGAVRRLIGLEVTTLRCISSSADARFFELECHEPDDATWVDRDALDALAPAHRAVVESCLAERAQDGGPFAVSWARPGWYAGAASWIRKHLPDAIVEQERTWSISTVLRARTPGGDFYFKAVPVLFASEPALTRELGRRHPGSAPAVVALDVDRGWMLMRDFEGAALAEGDAAVLCDAIRAYARLQFEWVDQVGDLYALGCPDRTLEAVEAEIDVVLGDSAALLPGRPGGLSPAELGGLPALAAGLRSACERLRAYGLPPTLEHGDLHAGNIRRRDDGFLVFDWSDGCVSMPFFSLVPFLEFGDIPHAREARDAYLGEWTAYAPLPRLVEAFELAQFVGRFHQAIGYHRITRHAETRARWEWERVFPALVKSLLDRL
jgi:Phosphotransferase enzyme family